MSIDISGNPWADPKTRKTAREHCQIEEAQTVTIPTAAFLALLDLVDEVQLAKHE